MAFRFSIAVHKAPDGTFTVLEAGEDADRALAARRDCELPGEVGVLINVAPDKLRKNRAPAGMEPQNAGGVGVVEAATSRRGRTTYSARAS
jgi:hypothetical protein